MTISRRTLIQVGAGTALAEVGRIAGYIKVLGSYPVAVL